MHISRRITALLITVLLLCGSANAVSAEADTNVLLGKTATTSLKEIAPSIAADKLTNGITNSDNDRYSSQTEQTASLVITVPLETFYDVRSVSMYERAVGDREYPKKNIKVEVGIYSEWGSVWTTALEERELPIELPASGAAASRNDFSFGTVTGDVLRITISLPEGGKTQYEFYEIEAYGAENPDAAGMQIKNVALAGSITSSIERENAQLDIDRLNDGVLDTSRNWFATNHTIGDKLVLTVDLDNTYKIFSVGLIERWITRACSDITSIDVGLTTESGTVLWKNALSGGRLNDGSTDGQLVSSDFMLGGVCADKLRITLDRADRQYKQYQLVELIILGADTAAVSYEIDGISVMRGSEETDTLTAGEATIAIRFPYMPNEDGSSQNALLICGVYDPKTNALKFLKAQTVALGQTETANIPCTVKSDWNGCEIRAFLCKAVTNLTAVSAQAKWR